MYIYIHKDIFKVYIGVIQEYIGGIEKNMETTIARIKYNAFAYCWECYRSAVFVLLRC